VTSHSSRVGRGEQLAGWRPGRTGGRRPEAVLLCAGQSLPAFFTLFSERFVRNPRAPRCAKMADLDDFFKKKDKKKKGEKKFAMANTDVLAKNLEQMAVKEEKALDKEISEMNNDSPNTPLNQQVCLK
jgi:hypothetical protein